jgi:type II secretory pathway pseudopilin PulG
MPAAPKTSKLAIASLVCALIPIVPITTVAALICSVKAKKNIRESQGTLTGSGLATAGLVISLVMGFMVLIIAALAALATPAILKQKRQAEMTRAMSNSKQIYLCMMDFESDMGTFPDDLTAKELPDPSLYQGKTANPYLAQLIAGGYCYDEIMFPMGPAGSKKSDNIMNPPQEILKQGENGWAYLLADDKTEEEDVIRGLNTSDGGDIPFLIAPLADSNGKIDPKPFDGRAVYIRIDGSARKERFAPGGPTPLDSTSWNNDFRPVVKMPK